MTPADELHAAAAKLRNLAAATGAQAWVADHFKEGTIVRPTTSRLSLFRLAADSTRAAGTPHVTKSVGEYIATMGPTVGVALATVFDAWARMGELDPDLLNRVGGRETLAVARAVLGSSDG